MVIIDTTFSRMQELIKKKITVNQLEQTLADMGMELDDVQGNDIKIEITADRTDLMSPEGLARAINSYKNFTKGYQEITINKGDYLHVVDKSVKEVRPFTKSFVVKGVILTNENIKSLMWLQEKIHDTYGRKRKRVAIGVYDLNKITFPITYIAKNPKDISFIPLDTNKKATAKQILETHPTGKKYSHLLENCKKYPLQIDNKGQILSMPPIINSNSLGSINTKTTDLFVESTGDNEEALDLIMNILATMFYDWGSKIYSVTIKDQKTSSICPSINSRTRKISSEYINKVIGINISTKDAIKLLPKMGYNVLETTGDNITVSIPSIRTDVWHQIDIADDVARAYGYNNIIPTLPNISTIAKMLPINIFKEDICNFLSGLNLLEVKTFALTNDQDQFDKMGCKSVKSSEYISLGKNTQDKDLSMVRSWLLPELIKSLVANRSKEYPQNIYEIGTVIIPKKNVDVRAVNKEKLVCLVCEEKADFTKIRQILDALLNYIGVECNFKETNHSSFIDGRTAEIKIKNQTIGIIGEISPQVLTNWGLAMPAVALELDLEALFDANK